MLDDLTLIFDSTLEQGLPNHFRRSDDSWVVSAGTEPSRLGLDSLMASGSQQPSLPELAGAVHRLGPHVVVVDLRQESHGFLGDHPVSWYAQKNWANEGKSLTEVEADEQGRIAQLAIGHSAMVARVYAKDAEGRLEDARPEEVLYVLAQDEKRATTWLGMEYLRIPVNDHSRPFDATVDRFIAFVRDLAPNAWLHFHCHAGDGRTTTFLLLYDMLRNAHALGLDEMAERQYRLGGVDLLHKPHPGWKAVLYDERAAFLRRFYDYASTRNFMAVFWSEYLAGK